MATLGIEIRPLDTLFFRDGRPFGESVRASGGLPQPQSLAGALRTHLLARNGFQFGKLRGRTSTREAVLAAGAPEWICDVRFRGPWLAQGSDGMVEPLLPMPVLLVRDDKEKRWGRARPERSKVPGWEPPASGMLPLWRKELPDAKPPGGFLTVAGIEAFLKGKLPEDGHWVKSDELFGYDHRTGIGVDPEKLTAAESQIYGISLLVLKKHVCLCAQVVAPPGHEEQLRRDLNGPFPYGGEGRHAVVEPCDWRAWSEADAAQQNLWLLATPGFFNGWKPELPGLKAAATGTPLAFSGWDVARGGPKPTRFAVPAGSVYFTDEHFIPEQGSLCAGEDAAQGWGIALRGAWTDE